MASYDTPREIAAAWLEGRKANKRLRTMYAGTVYRDGKYGPALFSYGDHHVIAFMRSDGSVALNEYGRSSTTTRHTTAAAIELTAHGYTATDETISGPNGHTFRVYQSNALDAMTQDAQDMGLYDDLTSPAA